MHLSRLWRDHVAAGYSSKLVGVEIAGSDAHALDAEITACVSAYLFRGMAVDERIVRRLLEISRALVEKQSQSDEHIAAYCAHLNKLVIAVLAEASSTQRPSMPEQLSRAADGAHGPPS
jgi:hypothetical protein